MTDQVRHANLGTFIQALEGIEAALNKAFAQKPEKMLRTAEAMEQRLGHYTVVEVMAAADWWSMTQEDRPSVKTFGEQLARMRGSSSASEVNREGCEDCHGGIRYMLRVWHEPAPTGDRPPRWHATERAAACDCSDGAYFRKSLGDWQEKRKRWEADPDTEIEISTRGTERPRVYWTHRGMPVFEVWMKLAQDDPAYEARVKTWREYNQVHRPAHAPTSEGNREVARKIRRLAEGGLGGRAAIEEMVRRRDEPVSVPYAEMSQGQVESWMESGR